jgi:hypothetical protein
MSGTGYGGPVPPGAPRDYGTPVPPGAPPGYPQGYGTPPPQGTPQPPAPQEYVAPSSAEAQATYNTPAPQVPPRADSVLFPPRPGGTGAEPPRPPVPGRGERRRSGGRQAGRSGTGQGIRQQLIVGPPRRVIISSVIGALASGSLLGLVLGVIAPAAPPRARVVTASAEGPGPSATAPTAAVSSSRGASPSPKQSVKIKTVTRSRSSETVRNPQNDPSMKLMILEDVWHADDGLVIRGKPGHLIGGDKAREFYESNGEKVRPFAVEPTGDAIEVKVRGDAVLIGARYIGFSDHHEIRKLSKDEFRERGRAAIDNGKKPPVWYKFGSGGDEKAVYVAEQYLG